MTTRQRVHKLFTILALVVFSGVSFADETPKDFPKFRHIDGGAAPPLDPVTGEVKLLTDVDFAPFSFKNGNSAMVGLSVEIAQAACAELRLNCVIVPTPFAELLPALNRGEGDAIITGLRNSPEILKNANMTRPYFFSFGRFVTRIGTPFETPDVRSLAGRRVGFVKGTSHQAFLEKYYERSALTPFENEEAAFEALRTGQLDVAFTDALHASFWLKGQASRGCCKVLGSGFVDRTTFTRGLTFLVRSDRENLRESLDYALDKLEEKNLSSKIFSRYLPESPF
jgi:polar amino acid transport system substrate-binding protein